MQGSSSGNYRALMQRFDLSPKKRLGQHFLLQPQLVDKIAAAAELSAVDLAIEIGPGLGILTEACARRAGLVVAVEKDVALFPILEEVLQGYDNVRLVAGDALTVDYDQLVAEQSGGFQGPCKVLGNLPYYLTSPLIMRFLGGGFRAELLVFMVQKEVAERMVATPGGKAYGSLSVAVQYFAEPEILFHVKPGSFYPPPDVVSTVIRLRRRSLPPVQVDDQQYYFQVVQGTFRYRRKTIQNALLQAGLVGSAAEGGEILAAAGLKPERRGETFDLAEFAVLTQTLLQAQGKEGRRCVSSVQQKGF